MNTLRKLSIVVALALAAAPVEALQSPEAMALDRAVTATERELRQTPSEARAAVLSTLIQVEQDARSRLAEGPAGDRSRLLKALSNLVGLRAEFSDSTHRERLAWSAESVQLAQDSGYAELLARAHTKHAAILKDSGDLLAAEEVLRESLVSVNAPNTRPWVSFALASIEQRLGKYESALQRLERLENELPSGDAWARFRWRIPGLRGQVLLLQGLSDLAAPGIEEEFAATRPLLEAPMAWALDIIAADVHRANLLLFRGQLTEAEGFVKERLQDEDLFNAHPLWRNVLIGIRGQALARLGRRDPDQQTRAEQLLRATLERPLPLADRVFCEVALANIQSFRGEYADARESLGRAAVASAEQNAPLSAITSLDRLTAELALAIESAETERTAKSRDRLGASWSEHLELWSRMPIRRAGRGLLSVPVRRGALSELIRAHVSLGERPAGATSALALLLDAQQRSSAVRALGGVRSDLASIRAKLMGPDHGIMLLLPAPDRSHLFLLDSTSLEHFELPEERVLAGRLASYLSLQKNADAEPGAAADLAALLLPEPAQLLVSSWNRLTVVQCAIERVPFEELPLPASVSGETLATRRLGSTHAIDFLPSLPLGLLLARNEIPVAPAAFALTLVSAPNGSTIAREISAETSQLDLQPGDLEQLAGTYPPGKSRILTGATATASRVFEPALFRNTTTLQFLTHGVESSELERPFALVLSPDNEADSGLLTCDEIDAEHDQRSPPLVILTACGSSRGPLRGGDEAAGHMGGAWLARGARSVLLTDRDMELGHALRLSATLHQGLAAGNSPAEALRHARRRDPSATRGVYLLGLAQDELLPAPLSPKAPAKKSIYLFAGAGLMLGALGLWLASKRLR